MPQSRDVADRDLVHPLRQFLQQPRIRRGQRKHLERALRELSPSSSHSVAPSRVQYGWRQCLAMSRAAFVLFSATLSLDTLRRARKDALVHAIEFVGSVNCRLEESGLLAILVQEYRRPIDVCQWPARDRPNWHG